MCVSCNLYLTKEGLALALRFTPPFYCVKLALFVNKVVVFLALIESCVAGFLEELRQGVYAFRQMNQCTRGNLSSFPPCRFRASVMVSAQCGCIAPVMNAERLAEQTGAVT